ncbi:MAG: hypothetical protein JWO74_2301 [Solirubrobacterales bacterium]|nr:hypothetical protein [Solirubrobacterales bacterium]
MRGVGSIELSWPEDPRAREQMRGFVAELADCRSVDDAFVAGITDDPDGEERHQRPDLAMKATARLRVWGSDDDAVSRAFDLVVWLARDVLGRHFPALPVMVPESVSGGADLARALDPALRSAEEAAREAARIDERADTARAHHWLLESAVRSARYLGSIPGRVNITTYRPNRQSNPLYACEKVASRCGETFLYAVALEPLAAAALERLGHPDFVTAGTARRGREALFAAGITEFGAGLERLAIALVDAYDRASAAGPVPASTALAAAEAVTPREHDAVALVRESPQLSDRQFPPTATTFAAAAEEVMARAVAEIATHLHSQSAAREIAAVSVDRAPGR